MPKVGGPQRGNQFKPHGNARENKTKKVVPKEQKKEVKKNEKPTKRTLDATVIDVLSGDTFKYVKVGDKEGKQVMAKIDSIIAPRFDREQKKEEKFTFESKEFLRSRIIGKRVKLIEMFVPEKGIAHYEVKIGDTDIGKTVVENGWAVSNKKYKSESQVAKDNKKGMYSGVQPVKKPEGEARNLFKPAPKEKEFSAVIDNVIGPAHFTIYTKDRRQGNVYLYGVSQLLEVSQDKESGEFYDFDEDGINAMTFIEPMIYQRDVRVTLIEEEERRFAIVKIDGKDIAEMLLREGYVVISKRATLEGEIKERYEKAEKEAKKNHKNRWTDFDQEYEDEQNRKKAEREKEILERKDKAKFYIGEIIKIDLNKFTIKVKADQSQREIRFASLKPTRFDEKNKEESIRAYRRRFRDIVRKYLVGKKFQCKECYKEVFELDGKKIESVRYDVYVNKKNFGIELVKNGLFNVIPERDPMRKSFEYTELENAEKEYEKKENNKGMFKFTPAQKIDKDNIDKTFPSLRNKSFLVQVESVSFHKLFIYIPEKNFEMGVFVNDVYVPRVENDKEFDKFRDEARAEILKEIGFGDVKVFFGEEEKSTRKFNVDVTYNQNKDLRKYLIDNFYASPIKEKSENVKKAEAEKKGIYKYIKERAPKEQKEEEEKPKRKEVKKQTIDFDGKKQKVIFVGFDGKEVYYYENEKESKYVDEIEEKLKQVKKENIKENTKNVIVEIKKRLYRGEIIEANPGAYEVICKDTGIRVCCGKNKLKNSTEEIDKLEIKVKKVGMIGIAPVRFDILDASILNELINGYQFKPAELTFNKKGDFVKVDIEEKCLNIMLVENGITIVNKEIGKRGDKSEFSQQIREAELEARTSHLNIWRFGDLDVEEFEDDKESKKKNQKK